MNDDRMSVHELAKALGKSPVWIADELRREHRRDVKHWPFATTTLGKTGRYNYVIIRSQFEKWKSGDNPIINYDLLADMVVDRAADRIADRVLERLNIG